MDGDLDLFLTGIDSQGATLLYKSEILNKKIPPAPNNRFNSHRFG
jgi:hypothetical protein